MPSNSPSAASKALRALAALGAPVLVALFLRAAETAAPPLTGNLRSVRLGTAVLRVSLPKRKAAAPPAPPVPSATWGRVYVFPNPARGVAPTVHVEAGDGAQVLLSFHDASGELVHRAEISGPARLIDDGSGPAPAYAYAWSGAKPGVYLCRVVVRKEGRDEMRKTVKLAVLP